jgi:hypothetical protein
MRNGTRRDYRGFWKSTVRSPRFSEFEFSIMAVTHEPNLLRSSEPTLGSTPLPPVGQDPNAPIPTGEIENALRQTINDALNLDLWQQGSGLQGLKRVQDHLVKAIHDQKRVLGNIRKHILSELASFPNAPNAAGVYRVKADDLRMARRKILLSGNVTAVRGASVAHESLVASLVSVGVCLTKYDGQIRSWKTVFMRHDCDLKAGNVVEEIRAILNQRARRSRIGPGAKGQDGITRLMRRAFQAAAERKALLEKAGSGWRMGYGVPAPYELVTGSGSMDLIDSVLPVLESLLLGDRRWVFVPDYLDSLAFSTLAASLAPGELAIFQKAKATLDDIVDGGHYSTAARAKVRKFADIAGDAIVIGGFRAGHFSPPQIFFAHAEHAIHAGLVAMADAELQPHRGFPLLLELAGVSAKTGLGIDAFQSMIESTYASAGAGSFYSPEGVILPESAE